jgi:hypothetical protein
VYARPAEPSWWDRLCASPLALESEPLAFADMVDVVARERGRGADDD